MTLDDVLQLLEPNFHCVVASASLDGQPWVSPVFFNYDPGVRIVFESERLSHHARLISDNPRVTIAVADLDHRGPPRGVYIESLAREVPPEGLENALDLFLNGPHRKPINRTVADYLGDKPLRLYEAIPQRLYGLTQVTAEGYEVDRRVEIPLPPTSSKGHP